MTGGYDERCAADLAAVAEGRDLSREDRAWLARVVAGAVRPNRDKPLWDLAHALAALASLTDARDGRDLVTLALDPWLAQADRLEPRFVDAGAAVDARGLNGPGGWRTTWTGLARLLALAEFVLTAEDLSHFPTLTGWLDDLAAAPDAEGAASLGRRLARHLTAYRRAHLPLAPRERRFRAILGFLDGRRAFTDDDILDCWRAELSAPASLDAVEGWEERLDASLADLAAAEPAESRRARSWSRNWPPRRARRAGASPSGPIRPCGARSPLEAPGRLRGSRLAPELCGLAVRPAAPGGRVAVGPELAAASRPPVRDRRRRGLLPARERPAKPRLRGPGHRRPSH